MSSRLWEGPSGNGFVSSRRISWDQEQGWAGGQNRDEHQASLSQPTGHLSASRRTSFPSSDETNLRLPSHEIPLISRVGAPTRRPRTPRNESAVKDGRKFLAAFREKRRNDDTGGSTSVPAAKKRGIDSLDVPPGLADAFTERLEVYQSCAPGLARSLEAALNASSLHRKHLGEDGTEGGDAGGGLKDGSEELHDHVMIDSVGDTRGNHDVSRGDIDDSLQRSNGTAAQPPPSMASSSSEGPTPEVSGTDVRWTRVVHGLLRTSRSCCASCNELNNRLVIEQRPAFVPLCDAHDKQLDRFRPNAADCYCTADCYCNAERYLAGICFGKCSRNFVGVFYYWNDVRLYATPCTLDRFVRRSILKS